LTIDDDGKRAQSTSSFPNVMRTSAPTGRRRCPDRGSAHRQLDELAVPQEEPLDARAACRRQIVLVEIRQRRRSHLPSRTGGRDERRRTACVDRDLDRRAAERRIARAAWPREHDRSVAAHDVAARSAARPLVDAELRAVEREVRREGG